MENYIFGQAVEIPKNSQHRFQHPPVGRILEWQQICFPVYTVSWITILQPTSPCVQPCFWHTIERWRRRITPVLYFCASGQMHVGTQDRWWPRSQTQIATKNTSNTDYPKLDGKLFSRIKLKKNPKQPISGLYFLYSNTIYFLFSFSYWQLLLFWVCMEQSVVSWILISLSIFSTFSCFPWKKWCCKEVADWSSIRGGIFPDVQHLVPFLYTPEHLWESHLVPLRHALCSVRPPVPNSPNFPEPGLTPVVA